MTIAPIALGSLLAASRADVVSTQAAEQSTSAANIVTVASDALPATGQAAEVSAAGAAVSAATAAAIARQDGLAPLMADLATALQSTDLPVAARAAIGNVLKLHIPLDANITGRDLARALAQSGIFLEANLAAAVTNPSSGPPAFDLKSALLLLRQALASPAAVSSLAGTAAALMATGARQPARHTAPDIVRASRPSPPYRGGSTTAQPVVPSTLATGASSAELVERMAQETDAALARQELLQIASIPLAGRDGSSVEPRWLFEIPFSTPQGTAVAQFEIGRDGRRSDDQERVPIWRARFSIQIDPIGPVHAQIAVSGEQAAIALWAERPAAAEQLSRDKPALARTLAGFDLAADISVHAGAPRREASPGRFVDRSS